VPHVAPGTSDVAEADSHTASDETAWCGRGTKQDGLSLVAFDIELDPACSLWHRRLREKADAVSSFESDMPMLHDGARRK
jgi:hypothetical protein